MPRPTNSSSPGTPSVAKREPLATIRVRVAWGAAVGLDQEEIAVAADRGDLVHRDLEPGRGRLLLEQRAQGVAGDALGGSRGSW